MNHLVAVYGSLKRGHFNHDLIEDAKFVGDDWLFDFTLYTLGPFPAIKRHKSDGVLVEIYEVTSHQLHLLDQLEGFNSKSPEKSFYLRVAIESSYGSAWVYEYNREVKKETRIESGNWCSADNNPRGLNHESDT